MTEVEYKICPVCNCKLRASRYTKHMDAQHAPEAEKVNCHLCNTKLIRKNLKMHLRNVHGIRQSKGYKPTSFKVENQTSSERAREILEAKKDSELSKNKEIASYLRRNPEKEMLGKFGVPQDKYRYGFYGSHSMEYDTWSKGESKK